MSRRMTSLLPLLLLGGIGCGSNEPVAAADTKPAATAPVAPVTADTKPATTAVVVAKALSLKELTLAAMAKSEAAVKADPKDHEQFARLGEARYYAGEDDAAIAALREAVKLKSESAEYLWTLARLLTATGKKEEAAKVQADLLARDRRYGLLVEIFLIEESLRENRTLDEAVWHVLQGSDSPTLETAFAANAPKAVGRITLNGSLPHVGAAKRATLTYHLIRVGDPNTRVLKLWETLYGDVELQQAQKLREATEEALNAVPFAEFDFNDFRANARRQDEPYLAYFREVRKWTAITLTKIDEAKTRLPEAKPKDE